MNLTMQIMLWYMAATACCSIFALFVALSTSARSRSTPPSVPLTRLALAEERLEYLEGALKTLRSRLTMQDMRARRSMLRSETPETEPDPDSPSRPSEVASADEKAEIRRRMNAATLKR